MGDFLVFWNKFFAEIESSTLAAVIFLSVIYTETQHRQDEECWLGCFISSPNFKFNFTSPAIYLSCQPQAPSVPLPLTLRSGFFWNLRCSPQVWLLPVMVLYNWISRVLGELLCIDSFGSLTDNAYHVPPHLPMASTSSPPLWLFIIMTREEIVFLEHSNSFRNLLLSFITSSSPHPVYSSPVHFLNSRHSFNDEAFLLLMSVFLHALAITILYLYLYLYLDPSRLWACLAIHFSMAP